MTCSLPAQTSITTLDRVYSPSQADLGKTIYTASCAACHRADLSGFSGPPLKGDLFLDRWREFNLSVLYDLIHRTMPANNAGALPTESYLAVLAYMLRENGLPAGDKPLRAETLAATLFVGPDGRRPLSSSAQVEVVGCMTEDSGNGFFLTSATEAARALDVFSISAEELQAARAKSPGSLVFRLQNLADLTGFKVEKALGKKMAAKGILVRQPKGDRINVTSLEMTGENCEP